MGTTIRIAALVSLAAVSVVGFYSCGGGDGTAVDGGVAGDVGPINCDPTNDKVDVLFVVDNSGSMAEEQRMLADAAAEFLTQLGTVSKDFHVGLVTTDVDFSPLLECKGSCGNGMDCTQATSVSGAVQPGKSYCTMACDVDADCPNYHCNSVGDCTPSVCGKILGFDADKKYCYPMNNGRLRYNPCKSGACEFSGDHEKVLTNDVAATVGDTDFQAMFRDNVKVGTNGTGFEKGLQALRNALDVEYVDPVTGRNVVEYENASFLRPEASLTLIVVSDEDDCSHDPFSPNFDEKMDVNDVCYPNPNTCHPDCLPRDSKGGCNPGEVATEATNDSLYVRMGGSYCMVQCTNDADCQAATVSGLKCTAVDGFYGAVKYCDCAFDSPMSNPTSKDFHLTPTDDFLNFFMGLKKDPYNVNMAVIIGTNRDGAEGLMETCSSPNGVACAGTRYYAVASGFTRYLIGSICKPEFKTLLKKIAAEVARPCYRTEGPS